VTLARPVESGRLILRPAALILGPPLLFVVLEATPFGMSVFIVVVGMLLFAFWIGIGLFATARAFLSWQRRDWRQFASWIAVPLAVGIATVKWNYTVSYTSIAGQTLNFAVNLPAYLERIDKLPRDASPKLEVFNRGGMIWYSSGVVYDESDEVRLPSGEQSAAWQERAQQSELGCRNFSITPLFGHFYLASFPC